MPILLENPTQEVRYIVGAQPTNLILQSDSINDQVVTEIKEQETKIEQSVLTLPLPETQVSVIQEETSLSPEKKSNVESEMIQSEDVTKENRESSPPPDLDRSVSMSLMPKLANIEKIIPESDNSSNSDKSDSDSSTTSEKASSNSDWGGVIEGPKKKSKKKPVEITIEDDDEV